MRKSQTVSWLSTRPLRPRSQARAGPSIRANSTPQPALTLRSAISHIAARSAKIPNTSRGKDRIDLSANWRSMRCGRNL